VFQALFNSLSGLFSFSRSLDTVSNNISNMNTPGFRGSDTFFENVNGGRGTNIAGEGLRTTSGTFNPTGNPTHLAIDGSGFFILRDDNGGLYYTRAGEFRWNADGMLVDSVTGYQVMAQDADGHLTPIDRTPFMTLPAVGTALINIAGNIAPGTASFTLPEMKIYSSTGAQHTLSITLDAELDAVTNNPTGNFKIGIKLDGNSVGPADALLTFDPVSHTLLAASEKLALNLTVDGQPQTVTLDFGTPGELTGSTRSLAGLGTTIGSTAIDGHGELGSLPPSFDEKGVLQFVYSATEKKQGPQLALANFPSETGMRLIGGRLLLGDAAGTRTIGHPGDAGFGSVRGGSLELANVDLTQEFADMIIIQRGYQASSRVMSVSNEMIEQLYNSTRGG
jgi:flagellar hook protein FlgE